MAAVAGFEVLDRTAAASVSGRGVGGEHLVPQAFDGVKQ
jgi:hypothetical protein